MANDDGIIVPCLAIWLTPEEIDRACDGDQSVVRPALEARTDGIRAVAGQPCMVCRCEPSGAISVHAFTDGPPLLVAPCCEACCRATDRREVESRSRGIYEALRAAGPPWALGLEGQTPQ